MQTILLRTFLLFALLSVVTPSWAITMDGTFTCGTWVKARNEKAPVVPIYQFWLRGFLSGLAVGTRIEFWKKKGSPLDLESVSLWMDNYCRTNPLKNIGDGGYSLFREHTNR